MNDSIKTLLIAVGLLVFIAAVWFFFLYNPEVSKISKIKKDTKELISKLQSFKVRPEQVDTLEAQIARLSKQIAAHEARVISKEELPFIVNRIHTTGKKYGVIFKRIIPDYDSLIEIGAGNNGEIYKLIMHIEMRASYKQFGIFLEALEKMPFMVSLGEITMAYNAESFPRLFVETELVLYLDEKVISES